jgi:DNA-directed RNA polymerase beta' subunit
MCHQGVIITPIQCISGHIELALPVFHCKIIAKQFTHPRMLQYGCETLIQYELQ